MKTKLNENGITLIALIITIIVLVILAAVSISAVYNSNIVNYAVNGATNYASEAKRENEILDQTASIIESAVDRISDIAGGNTGENPGGDEGEEPETPPVEEPPVIGIDFGSLTEEEKDELVGQYVDYTPISGTFNDHVKIYSGSSANSRILTDMNLKWRILESNHNTLVLISDTSLSVAFSLLGENGYNNGVLLLNNACKALYSNSSLGATGRSLNIEDIEKHSNYEGATLEEHTVLSDFYYPNIFAREITGAPNGTYGTELDLSEQDEYVTGNSIGNTSFKGKETYYTYTMSTSNMSSKYLELFANKKGSVTTPRTAYWLASRCVHYSEGVFDFRLFYVNHATIDADWLSYTDGRGLEKSYAICPVVEIDLSKVYVGETGSGADGDAYSIVAR